MKKNACFWPLFLPQRHLPYQCTWSMLPVFSGVRVAHLLLLLCMYYFSYFMSFVVYVFHVWSLFLDCILLITTRTLVPLTTLTLWHLSANKKFKLKEWLLTSITWCTLNNNLRRLFSSRPKNITVIPYNLNLVSEFNE